MGVEESLRCNSIGYEKYEEDEEEDYQFQRHTTDHHGFRTNFAINRVKLK